MRKLIVMGLLLTGCAGQSEIINSYVGKPEGYLYSRAGAPARSIDLRDGRKVATFPVRNPYGQVICDRTFIVSPSGTVESGTSSCPF